MMAAIADRISAWRRVKLKDVCADITVGHVGPMADEYVEQGIPFLRSQNVQPFRIDVSSIKYITPAFHQRLRKSALMPGDVVVVRTGYPGTASVIPNNLQVANCADLVIIRPSAIVDPYYLTCLFNSTWGQGHVAGTLVGVAQQHFNIGAAREMVVNLPPLPIQRKIAAILSAYDDLIENNTRRIALLEAMAQALYCEWFVRFRFPGHEAARLVDSPLGVIPEGWRVVKLGEFCEIVMGKSPSSEFYNESGGGLPFHQGVRDFGEHFPTDRVYCTASAVRIAEPGDILFSVRAPVGRINVATHQVILGRGLSAIRSRTGNQVFVYFQLKDRFREEDSMGNGAIFKAVSKDEMRGIEMIQPPSPIIESFEHHTTPMFKQIKTLTFRNANLRQTRDLLLPRLVSGAVDVAGVEVAMGEIAGG